MMTVSLFISRAANCPPCTIPFANVQSADTEDAFFTRETFAIAPTRVNLSRNTLSRQEGNHSSWHKHVFWASHLVSQEG